MDKAKVCMGLLVLKERKKTTFYSVFYFSIFNCVTTQTTVICFDLDSGVLYLVCLEFLEI